MFAMIKGSHLAGFAKRPADISCVRKMVNAENPDLRAD